MANTGKTIKQFSLLTKLSNDDGVIIQRGNSYFYTKAQSIASGALIEDTYANVGSLISGDNLERGATYYITDKYIWLFAIDSDKFDLNGVYFARNADYNSTGVYAGITVANGFTVNATGVNLGVWTSALIPASGDVVVWNNLHYLNITGANGTTNPSLDVTNYELVANTSILTANSYGYIYEFDAIEYDFTADTINRRVDLRGNDIGGGVSTFQWGNDVVYSNTVQAGCNIDNINSVIGTNFHSNSVLGLGTLMLPDGVIIGQVVSNTIISAFEVVESTATSLTLLENYIAYPDGVNLYAIQGGVALFVNNTIQHNHDATTINIYLYTAATSNNSAIGITNNMPVTIQLNAAAYNAGTTYDFGDYATDGTKTYMFINSTSTSGIATSDTAYWVEVYDFTTAGRYKLTISKYHEAYGYFTISSTLLTHTIDEIVFSSAYYNQVRFECSGAIETTFDNTAVASLANTGEIIASADVVVDGAKEEFAVFERILISAVPYIRVVYSQTSNA